MHNVLVTGIGGNVGYGILKNIRSCYPDISLVGTNTSRISAGNHLCDVVYEVPFSTDEAYLPAMQKICHDHSIDLIIPSTDYEIYILALHQNILPTVAASPADTSRAFLDKYLSFHVLNSLGLSFATSILPSAYNYEFGECIVKPREGRGSRNIFVNPDDVSSFGDDYVVQPLLKGKEITTAFYVTKNNDLHGHITMERSLSGGATVMCEVTTEFDKDLNSYLRTLTANIEIKGSCNLQSIVTADGIIPFEVNCRISGTNSIRSQFGFRDVSYTIDEYLYGKYPEPPQVIKGSALRILYDVIYPGIKLSDINNASDNFHIYG